MSEPVIEGRSRETKIRRDARGRWWSDGVEITHPGLCRSFDAWIERADDGRYCLKNDVNWAYVAIEGPPLFVRDVVLTGIDASPSVSLVLSDERVEPLAPETLREDEDGVLHADARRGTMPCAFEPRALVGLAPWLDEDERGSFLRLGARRVRIASVEDALVPFRGAVIEGASP